MSLTKTTMARRMALLSSSSLGLAAIVSAASLGVALAPGQASAQCMPAAPAPGAGADTIGCPSSTTAYDPGGIVFTSDGDLTVNVTGSAATNVGAGGVRLTAGALEDDLTFNRTGGAISGNTNTAPVVVDLQSQDGDITAVVGAVSGNAANVQYGLRAQSSGAGDIDISATGGTIGTGTGATNPGIAAIYASSNGGDIIIHQDFRASQATANGRLYGIQASTTGDGNLSLLATKAPSGSGGNQATTSSSGVAAIDASVETGDLLIQVVGAVNNSNATGIGIRARTRGGDAVIDIIQSSVQAGASGASPNAAVIALDMQGGLTTINNLGIGRLGSNSSSDRGDPILRALGSGAIAINNGRDMYGTFQLGGFSGAFTLDNSTATGNWRTVGQSVFSQGADTLNNLVGGVMVFGRVPSSGAWVQSTTLAFGTGDDTINNTGLIVVGENHVNNSNAINAHTLTITGLNRFNNAGLIVMGSYQPSLGGVLGAQTDSYYDDVIVMRDGHFHGEEGSRIWLDANLNNTGQTSCARNAEGLSETAALSDPAAARLRANDCLDFRGSGASGRTGFIIADAVAGDRGAYNPRGNVIVDVLGADPADIDPDAFFVDPSTPGYVATSVGFLDKGLFAYAIGYDAEDEAFKIYGVESQSSAQFTLLGQAANDLWRTATSPWLGRRAAQRDAEADGGLTTRFWVRGTLSSADRTVQDTVAIGAGALVFDNSYAQKDAAVALGMDLARGSAFGGEWVAGAMAGYTQAKVSYGASVNTATFEGGSVGVYGGFTAGPFFHDMVVNGTLTNLLIDVPSLNLTPSDTLLESDVLTLGAHMETGWRFAFGPVRVEPLATLSWSQTEFDAMDVPADDPLRLGGEVEFDKARSLRAGLGLRLGMNDVAPSLLPIDVSLTGRSMQEWDGEAGVTIVNLGDDAVLSRSFDGGYNELTAGVSVGDETGHVSGFLNIGGVWGDDYEARTGSVGVRLRW